MAPSTPAVKYDEDRDKIVRVRVVTISLLSD